MKDSKDILNLGTTTQYAGDENINMAEFMDFFLSLSQRVSSLTSTGWKEKGQTDIVFHIGLKMEAAFHWTNRTCWEETLHISVQHI